MLRIAKCRLPLSVGFVLLSTSSSPLYAGDETYFQKGYRLFEQGQYEQAASMYSSWLTSHPDSAGAFNNRGLCYSRLSQFEKAITDFDHAIALKSDDAKAYFNRGKSYSSLEQLDKAKADYDRAIALKPDYADAYVERGYSRQRLGQSGGAIADYDRAIVLKPDYANAYTLRGGLYTLQDQHDKAIVDYNKAIALNPDASDSYVGRGFSYDSLGQLDKAIADFTRAIALNPKSANAYNNRGYSYKRKGQFDNAIADLDRAIALNPNQVYAYFNRGEVLARRDRLTESFRDFERAFQLNKNNSQFYSARAVAYFISGDRAKGVADVEKALNLAKNQESIEKAKLVKGEFMGELRTPTIATMHDPSNLAPAPSKVVSTMTMAPVVPTVPSANAQPAAVPSPATRPTVNQVSADVDFGPYLADLRRRIKRAWFPPKRESSSRVELEFKVHDNGVMSDLRLHSSSGIAVVDQAALKSVENASPFRPLPAGAAPSVLSRFCFEYSPGNTSATISGVVSGKLLDEFGGIYSQTEPSKIAEGSPFHSLQERNIFGDSAAGASDVLRRQRIQEEAQRIADAKLARKQADDAEAKRIAEQIYAEKSRNEVAIVEGLSNGLPLSPSSSANNAVSSETDEQRQARVRARAEQLATEALKRRHAEEEEARKLADQILEQRTANGRVAPLIAATNASTLPVLSELSNPVGREAKPVTDKWALIVGISKFAHPEYNLRYAAKDATDFQSFLINEANFATDHIKSLIDEQATAKNIKTAFGDRWLPNMVMPGDLVVIYISTHGTPATKDKGKRNYIVAHDTDRDELYATGVAMDEICERIKNSVNTDRVVIVMDTCYSGAASGAKGSEGADNFNVTELAQAMGKGRLILSSSGPSQRSWESKGYANGVFTRFLLEALRENHGNIDVRKAFENIKGAVSWEVRRDHNGAEQTPTIAGEWEGADPVISVKPSKPRPMGN